LSAQECSTQAYSPGLQAADDSRRSKLNVGETYYYAIRASSRNSWKNSNPTIIPHKIKWQASIDGKVSLSESSGGLPIANVLVEYRLKSLNGTIIPTCANTSDWWYVL
jgi:hypothetical protein